MMPPQPGATDVAAEPAVAPPPHAAAFYATSLSKAIDSIRDRDIDAARERVRAPDAAATATLAEALHTYQIELEAQAEQFRESQARTERCLGWYVQLFRDLPQAALVCDRSGGITEFNTAALRLVGGGPSGTPPALLWRLAADPDSELALYRHLVRAADVGHADLPVVNLRRGDGSGFVAHARMTALPPDPRDRTPSVRVLIALEDRSDWHALQQARTDAAQARTLQAAAEAAARAKTEVLSRVSHELRTPLNAILGFSQLLLLGKPDALAPGQRSQVELIRDAGGLLLELVDEVLDFNRSEAGALPVTLQPLFVAPMAQKVLDTLAPLASPRQISLCRVESELGTEDRALADPRRVVQVLTNLVSNAIKFNRPGGSVQVRLHRDGRRLGLTVADDGIGMSEAQLAHLFEPFNRLGADNLRIEGTGLGLSISQRLARAMGGSIDVESRPRAGSRFTLWLPRFDG